MTKKELIDLLAEYPDDTVLVVEDDRDDGCDIDTLDIDRIEMVEHSVSEEEYIDVPRRIYPAPYQDSIPALVFRPKH